MILTLGRYLHESLHAQWIIYYTVLTQKLLILLTECIYVIRMVLRINPDIYLKNINHLGFF
jgi:hypothetical protein